MTAIYRDKNGTIETIMKNDGTTLFLTLRGVEFTSSDFESFEPVDPTDISRLESFTLYRGELCACNLDVEMPVGILLNGETTQGLLLVHLKLSEPSSGGMITTLGLQLKIKDRLYTSSRNSGWFEDDLLDLHRQLPEGTGLKACISCMFSDYHPAGHGMFGGMACFRDNKNAYKSVKSKQDLFQIWSTKSDLVQETYLCPEFEERASGTGYRG